MKGLSACRKEGFLFLAILAIFFITSVKVPEQIGVCRYTAAYQSDDASDDVVRLASLVGYQLPGGVKVTDPARLAELRKARGGMKPAFAVAMPGVTSESVGSDLIFPHVADGRDVPSALIIESTIVLINTSNRESKVTIEFFKDNGTALELTIGGVLASKFDYTVPIGNTRRIKTDAVGTFKVGWARVHMSQPVSGVLTFSIRLGGALKAEVGVDNSALGTETAVFAQIEGDATTAFAYVNPDTSTSVPVEIILSAMNGSQLQTTTRTLGPGGRESKFIDELFPSLKGSKFQGVLRFKSQKPIGVLTLRQKVLHLTSLPSVRRFEADEAASDLCFYRVGAGAMGGLLIQTSFLLINNSDAPVAAVLDLFQQDGTPLSVDVGSMQGATLNLTVNAHGAVLLTTQDRGGLKLGWARLRPDHPLGAAGTFTILTTGATDTFASEVGVDTTIPLKLSKMFADTIGDRNTGIAVSNTSETEEATIYVALYDKSNSYKASKSIKLKPKEHYSQFITEIFPAAQYPNLGIDDFEGRLEVGGSASSSGDTVVITGTLRQAGALLTSLPTMIELHGFQPQAQVELLSQLGGSSPGALLKVQQYEGDMCLDQLEVSIPEMSFDKSLFVPGEMVMTADSGGLQDSNLTTVAMVESVEADGTVKLTIYRYGISTSQYDPVDYVPSSELDLSGSPTSGGFKAVYRFLGKKPATYISDDFFTQIYMPPNALILPQQGTIGVRATFTSVSTSRRQATPLLAKSSQDIALPAFTAGAPQILNLVPYRGRSGGPVGILGANLPANTADMQVLFTGSDGSPVAAPIMAREGNNIAVQAPAGIKTGPVIIKTASQESNPYTYILTFQAADTFTLGSATAGSAVNFSTSLKQQVGEFQFLNWKTAISGASLKTTGLAAEQVVGTAKWSEYSYYDFQMKVESVSANELILKLVRVGDTWVEMRFRLTNQTGGGVLIENVPKDPPVLPVFVTSPYSLEWSTTVPLTQLPAGAGGAVTAEVTKTSCMFTRDSASSFETYSTWNFTTN